ncbi:hypothetical protein FACS189460_2150 [Deltaproteobacteria bacterium]|nr:hypothetical protein FACS189460_2150 [Deltaproteobacteria bacterium]
MVNQLYVSATFTNNNTNNETTAVAVIADFFEKKIPLNISSTPKTAEKIIAFISYKQALPVLSFY